MNLIAIVLSLFRDHSAASNALPVIVFVRVQSPRHTIASRQKLIQLNLLFAHAKQQIKWIVFDIAIMRHARRPIALSEGAAGEKQKNCRQQVS
ncbi:MAG: hypothetical protein NXH70_09325 [Hyphomonas sp.]|nr:hypothetical protein [Hyphomonas sp.]